MKVPQERRVAVVEKGTGKTLTGHKAPRESELKDWLQKHPTFEVLKSHRRLSLRMFGAFMRIGLFFQLQDTRLIQHSSGLSDETSNLGHISV